MDVNFIGRQHGLTDRFRTYATEKSDKLSRLAPRATALEVKFTRDHERGASDDRVELTVIGFGPVVRAEADASDKYAAFDHAFGRLLERVRRAHDRKKVHSGKHRPLSLQKASARDFSDVDVTPADADTMKRVLSGESRVPPSQSDSEADEVYSPVVIRSKVFSAAPMTIDDALYFMELVGHDFYLFVDSESGRPCVVYRRKGWAYGVIGLETASTDTSR